MEKLKNVFNTMVEKVKHFYSTKRKERVVVSVLALLALVTVTVFAVNSMVKPVNPTVDVKDPEVVEKEDEVETDEVEVEKPADRDEDKVEKPADKDEDKVEKPADKDEDKVEKPTEKPAEKPTEKPSDRPADKPVAKPNPKPTPKPDPKPTPPPAHTHNWVAVYKEHPAETKDVWVDRIVKDGEPGYYVGNGWDIFVSRAEIAKLYGRPGAIADWMFDNGHGDKNYMASNKVTSFGYYETQVVKPAWKELTHYVCHADGATKQP